MPRILLWKSNIDDIWGYIKQLLGKYAYFPGGCFFVALRMGEENDRL